MADSCDGSGGELKQQQLIKCNVCYTLNLRVLFPRAPRETPLNHRAGLQKGAQQQEGDPSGVRLLGRFPAALKRCRSSHHSQLKKSPTASTLLCCPPSTRLFCPFTLFFLALLRRHRDRICLTLSELLRIGRIYV